MQEAQIGTRFLFDSRLFTTCWGWPWLDKDPEHCSFPCCVFPVVYALQCTFWKDSFFLVGFFMPMGKKLLGFCLIPVFIRKKLLCGGKITSRLIKVTFSSSVCVLQWVFLWSVNGRAFLSLCLCVFAQDICYVSKLGFSLWVCRLLPVSKQRPEFTSYSAVCHPTP